MKILSSFNAARMSRALMGGAALAIAAAITAFAPAVTMAQGKSNVGGCTSFTSFSYDATTNTLTVNNCTTTQQPPPAPPVPGPSTYTLSAATSTPAGVAINVTVQRTGGTSAEGVLLSIGANGLTGWNFNGASTPQLLTINFLDNETTKSLNFNPGSTPGVFGMTFGGVTGTTGSIAAGTTFINVLDPLPPSNVPVGCKTSATKNEVFQYANQKIVFSLKPGETGAVAFTPGAGTALMYLSSTETVNTPPDADHEVTVSTCPGDFDRSYPCRYQANYVGSSMQANTAPSPWQCALVPGQTYFLNVRHVKLRASQTDPVQTSCTNPPAYTNGACEVRLQNTGL
jgi:hypothetical protein